MNRIVKAAIFEERTCEECGAVFTISIGDAHQRSKRLCSKECQIKGGTRRFLLATSKKKKLSTEELRIRSLASGRRSYRKHREERIFYYKKMVAIRKGVKGDFSDEGWKDILKRQKHICLLCKKKMERPTIDHIIPISKWELWKLDNPVDYECNDIQNIQALCKSCNSRKRDRITVI